MLPSERCQVGPGGQLLGPTRHVCGAALKCPKCRSWHRTSLPSEPHSPGASSRASERASESRDPAPERASRSSLGHSKVPRVSVLAPNWVPLGVRQPLGAGQPGPDRSDATIPGRSSESSDLARIPRRNGVTGTFHAGASVRLKPACGLLVEWRRWHLPWKPLVA